MAIKDWHEDDRPREKLLKFGAAHLSDAEILAIFLLILFYLGLTILIILFIENF